MEKEIRELKDSLESKAHEVKSKAQSVKEGEEQVAKLGSMFARSREATRRARKEHNKLDERVREAGARPAGAARSNVALVAENKKAANELKMRVDEANAASGGAGRVVQVKESTLNKLRAAEKEKTDVEKSRDDLKRVIGSSRRDRSAAHARLRRAERSRMSSSASETCS